MSQDALGTVFTDLRLGSNHIYTPQEVENRVSEVRDLKEEDKALVEQYKAIREEGHWRGTSAIDRRRKEIKTRLEILQAIAESHKERGLVDKYGACGERTDLLGDIIRAYRDAQYGVIRFKEKVAESRDPLYTIRHETESLIREYVMVEITSEILNWFRKEWEDNQEVPSLDKLMEIMDTVLNDKARRLTSDEIRTSVSTSIMTNAHDHLRAAIVLDIALGNFPRTFTNHRWLKAKKANGYIQDDYDVPCPVCGKCNCATWGAKYPGHDVYYLPETAEAYADQASAYGAPTYKVEEVLRDHYGLTPDAAQDLVVEYFGGL